MIDLAELVVLVSEGAGVDDDSAAFTTLGAIALHGFRLTEAAVGEQVTVIGLAAIVGGTIMVVWAVRSEKFTQRVGEWLGRFMSWFLVEFNKNPLEDLGPKGSMQSLEIGQGYAHAHEREIIVPI